MSESIKADRLAARREGLRRAAGRALTGRAKAAVAAEVGLDVTQLKRLAKGESANPRLDTLSALADYLGTNVGDVLEENSLPSPPGAPTPGRVEIDARIAAKLKRLVLEFAAVAEKMGGPGKP